MLKEHLVIFNEQDGFGAAKKWFFCGLLFRFNSLARPGKIDIEYCPQSRFAVDGEKAVVLLDRAINGGQSQSGSRADLFGGVEWLEDVGLSLLIHAAAIVTHGKQDIITRHNIVGKSANGALVQSAVFRLNRYFAGTGDRVTGS